VYIIACQGRNIWSFKFLFDNFAVVFYNFPFVLYSFQFILNTSNLYPKMFYLKCIISHLNSIFLFCIVLFSICIVHVYFLLVFCIFDLYCINFYFYCFFCFVTLDTITLIHIMSIRWCVKCSELFVGCVKSSLFTFSIIYNFLLTFAFQIF
jgi:hypothetical protein